MARKSNTLTDLERLQLVAMSLATDELRLGLDSLLTLALMQGTQHEDWDQLADLMGWDDYQIACVKAAQGWIKKVTGMSEFHKPMINSQRDKKK